MLTVILGKASGLIEKLIFKLNKQFNWLGVMRFEQILHEIISIIQKETQATIIVIGIGKTSNNVESKLTGTKDKIIIYNNVLKNICKSYKNTYFVDTYNLLGIVDMSDGIHYNSNGHKKIARSIVNIIKEI